MAETTEKRALVDQHLGYVRALAAEIARGLPAQVEMGDLVALGTAGLIEAAERYESGRGAAFTTFAYYRIRGAIYDGLRKMATLPRRAWERARLLERVDDYLESAGQASAAAAPSTAIEAAVAMRDALADVVTIYVTIAAGEIERAEARDVGVDERMGRAQTAARARQAIQGLPDNERQILMDHYFGELTLDEAGAKLGLSKSWASRLHARAIRKLRLSLAE